MDAYIAQLPLKTKEDWEYMRSVLEFQKEENTCSDAYDCAEKVSAFINTNGKYVLPDPFFQQIMQLNKKQEINFLEYIILNQHLFSLPKPEKYNYVRIPKGYRCAKIVKNDNDYSWRPNFTKGWWGGRRPRRPRRKTRRTRK